MSATLPLEHAPQPNSHESGESADLPPYRLISDQEATTTRRQQAVERLLTVNISELHQIAPGQNVIKRLEEFTRMGKEQGSVQINDVYFKPEQTQRVENVLLDLQEGKSLQDLFERVRTATDPKMKQELLADLKTFGMRLLHAVAPQNEKEWHEANFMATNRKLYTRLAERIVLETELIQIENPGFDLQSPRVERYKRDLSLYASRVTVLPHFKDRLLAAIQKLRDKAKVKQTPYEKGMQKLSQTIDAAHQESKKGPYISPDQARQWDEEFKHKAREKRKLSRFEQIADLYEGGYVDDIASVKKARKKRNKQNKGSQKKNKSGGILE